MRPSLSILLGACCLLPLSCRENSDSKKTPPPKKAEKQEEELDPKKRSLINVPAGAVISDLTLPYFNEKKERVSLLTIKELTVNTDEGITGETLLNGHALKLWLFEKNGAIRTTTTIPKALYRVEKDLIEAQGEILMRAADDRFAAKSNGGIFTLETGQALLLGPATTRFNLPPKKKDTTAMNLRPLLPAALTTALVAAPPEITPQQMADFERQVAPRIIPSYDGDRNFQEADQLEQPVNRRLFNYLDSVDQTVLISQTVPVPPADVEDPLKDLFKPGPESIVITCSKGVYLDGENREIVYLGEIAIEGQGLTMTCNQDLKAMFNPPPVAPKKAKAAESKKKDDPLSKFGGFGDLKQFTASGDVRISGVNENGRKVYFGGDRALYEMTKDGEKINSTVTLRGDQLAFMLGDPKDPKNAEGTVALRSISPNAWIIATIKNGIIQVVTSKDGWQTVVLPGK